MDVETYIEEATQLKSEDDAAKEICDLALEPSGEIFKAITSIEKNFQAINIKCNSRSVQDFIKFAIRYETVTAINGALQRRINELDGVSQDLFGAMSRRGITPEHISDVLLDCLNSKKESIKLSAVKMAIPLQLEKDNSSKYKRTKDMKVAEVEESNNSIVLKSVIDKIRNPKISELSIGD